MAITISGDSPNITTLALTTLSDGTNSTSSTNAIQGSAKAWVCFNGTGPAVRGSYNVSSITRIATGNYTVNFTNAMANTNYAFSGSVGYDTTPNQTAGVAGLNNTARATWKQTTSLSIFTGYANTLTSTSDPSDISVMVFS